MNNYSVILFDLDGTLTDSKLGITRCVQYALDKLGRPERDLDKLEPFIGPPLQETFSSIYGFSEEEVSQAIGYYRERFKSVGMFENEVYPQIRELLAELKEQNKRLIVATSKPTPFAEQILRYFELDPYFELIAGSNLDGTRASKTEVIAYVLGQLSGVDKQDVVMVGDRKHDIIGANNTGIHSIAVMYGYGSLEELQPVEPTYMVHSTAELREVLSGKGEALGSGR
ncbi:HAD family hydrolase [Paenibacillus filicis]|uniref:HAD family hydrolase n=1 Tax=Paenibacillus filicis TaxID=669464 RepID=A0ABU9DH53_9BACL